MTYTPPLKTKIKRLIRDIGLITVFSLGVLSTYLFMPDTRYWWKKKGGYRKLIVSAMQETVWEEDKIEDEIREKGVVDYFSKK